MTVNIRVPVLIPNHPVQDVRFGMRLPRFSTPCDPNSYCQNSLFMLQLTQQNRSSSAQFPPESFGSAPVVSISWSMLVTLARLVKLNGLVSNCMPTLFSWSWVCLWKHFRHHSHHLNIIHNGITWMWWLAKRLQKSFSPQHSGGL